MAKLKANYVVELKKCTKCGKSKLLFEFWKHKQCKGGYNTYCKKCVCEYQRKYYKTHRKQEMARTTKYRNKNKKRCNAYSRNYHVKQREKVIKHYGNKCNCCGEANIRFLTIDHINGDGRKHRKEIGNMGSGWYNWIIRNNYPVDLQILCFNCNCGRQANGGICPHKEE